MRLITVWQPKLKVGEPSGGLPLGTQSFCGRIAATSNFGAAADCARRNGAVIAPTEVSTTTPNIPARPKPPWDWDPSRSIIRPPTALEDAPKVGLSYGPPGSLRLRR